MAVAALLALAVGACLGYLQRQTDAAAPSLVVLPVAHAAQTEALADSMTR